MLTEKFTRPQFRTPFVAAGLLACLAGLSACGSDDTNTGASGVLGTATRIDPGTNSYYSLEGPYWVAAEGGYVLFSDVVEKDGATAGIHKYVPSTGTFSKYTYPAATPTSTNGLGLDSMGRLIATERYKGRLVRVVGTTITPIVTEYQGATLNAPNDLVVGKNDNIYFTDTLWGSVKMGTALAPNSAYRVAPDGAVTRIYSSSSINGIALSPDGNTLYVGNDMENKVWKFAVNADGSVNSTPTDFLTKSSVPGDKFIIPDGINVDDDGNVYVALNDHAVNAVAVFKPSGEYIGKYDVPVALDAGKTDTGGNGPSNITFGGADRKTLYITTHHALWQVAVNTPGKP